MALSASFDWTLTRNQIITRALRIIRVIEQGDTPSPEQLTGGAEALNMLIQAYPVDLSLLWAYEWKTHNFTASSEVTGTDGEVYTCTRSHASAATTRPITGANYTSYWVLRGTTGGGWVTATAYSSINEVNFAPTTTGIIGIDKAFIRYQGSDYPTLEIQSLAKYLEISTKDNTGTPILLAFDNTLTPKAYLYPHPDSTEMVLHYLAVKKLQDFDTASNDPDMYARFLRMLVFDLAGDLAPEYGVSLEEIKYLEIKGSGLKKRAKANDRDRNENEFIKGAF